jgi:hypothetical protein
VKLKEFVEADQIAAERGESRHPFLPAIIVQAMTGIFSLLLESRAMRLSAFYSGLIFKRSNYHLPTVPLP